MPGLEPMDAIELAGVRAFEAAEYDRLWLLAVDVLGQAVRLRRTSPWGQQVDPADFAGFLASALGAVAANLGDVELGGR